MFLEIFDQISKMQKLVVWIRGEMSFLGMFGFYFGALFLGFLLTSCRKTIDARFHLVVLFIIAFALERSFYDYLSSQQPTPTPVRLIYMTLNNIPPHTTLP